MVAAVNEMRRQLLGFVELGLQAVLQDAGPEVDSRQLEVISANYFSLLVGASFLTGGDANFSKRGDLEEVGNALVGNLYVRLIGVQKIETLRMEILGADEGYNRIFVRPMSDVLDTRVPNLERLRGLCGNDDTIMMQFIERVVVLECFELGETATPTSTCWHVVPFKQTVVKIAQALAAPNVPDSGRGYVHLLKMRGEGGKERWVLRATSTFSEMVQNGSASTLSGVQVKWRFIDITTAVKSGAIQGLHSNTAG